MSAGQGKFYQNPEFDYVKFGTHCADCYPGNCPMKVYVKDGKVVREEPSGTLPTIDPSVPDYNPMGCMPGTSWSQSLDGPDRAAYPLKRVGERGAGDPRPTVPWPSRRCAGRPLLAHPPARASPGRRGPRPPSPTRRGPRPVNPRNPGLRASRARRR